jgi:hypothetical protein
MIFVRSRKIMKDHLRHGGKDGERAGKEQRDDGARDDHASGAAAVLS